MDVFTCNEATDSCFQATAYRHEMNMEYFGCGTCDMLDDLLPDAVMSCMECMTDNCNEVSGAEHLALSSLFLVLPAVLLY